MSINFGTGRVIKLARIEPDTLINCLKNIGFVSSILDQPENPLVHHLENGNMLISTTSKTKNIGNEGTLLITNNTQLGTITLVVKEVNQSIRPVKDLMPIQDFLDTCGGCTKSEFLKRNYVKAGKNTLLQRFRYVIPNSLIWHQIQPVRVDGLYVCDIGFIAEMLNSRKASSLFTTEKSPHFMCYYPLVNPTENVSHILIEQCDMCMANDFRIHGRSESKMQTYLIQTLLAVRTMQAEFKMIHNDLFVYNLTVKRIRGNLKWKSKTMSEYTWWKYDLGEQSVYLKQPENIVKLTGFGFASSFDDGGGILRRDIAHGDLVDVGMWSTYTPQSDIMTLLFDFIDNYECKAAQMCVDDISKRYGFIDINDLRSCILVTGTNYRIDATYIADLDIDWVIENMIGHCYDTIVTHDPPPIACNVMEI